MAGVLSSLRYLFADIIGDDEEAPPLLPDGLSGAAAPIVREAIDRLIDYQGPSYARLYVDRLRRFVGRRDVDGAMLCELARLMALRMSYEDPIRIAQLKLAEAGDGDPRPLSTDDVARFRFDELVGALPAKVAEPVLDVLEWLRWKHRPVVVRFSVKSRWGLRRLKIEAALRRWRLFSVRYASERAWVERWLHMIDRSLTKQPAAAFEIVRTATMISRLWRCLSPRRCRLACDHRRAGQAGVRRCAVAAGPCRRGRRGACRRPAGSAAGRPQAQDRRDPGPRPRCGWVAVAWRHRRANAHRMTVRAHDGYRDQS